MSFSAFDPDFRVPHAQPAPEALAVQLAEMRALRTEAQGGAAVAHRMRKALLKGGARPVSRREAEVLFEVVESSREGESAPFAALFCAAMMNHILAGAEAEGPTSNRACWLDAAVLDAAAGGASLADVYAKVLTAALSEESASAGEGWTARAASDALLHDLIQAARLDQNWAVQRLRAGTGQASLAERLLRQGMGAACGLDAGQTVARAA